MAGMPEMPEQFSATDAAIAAAPRIAYAHARMRKFQGSKHCSKNPLRLRIRAG